MRLRCRFHFRYMTISNILLTLRVYFTKSIEHLRIFLVGLGNSSEFLGRIEVSEMI